MDHRAQAGDEGHQEGDGQHGVSVGGDGHSPGVVLLLLVVVKVVEEVGEEYEGDGGEREETGRHQEQRRAG